MAFSKEQVALAKRERKALVDFTIDGRHCKSEYHTGKYNHKGPVEEGLARAVWFFSLDVLINDTPSLEAYQKFFPVRKPPTKLVVSKKSTKKSKK